MFYPTRGVAPFNALSLLGDTRRLRGHYEGRFHGRNAALLQPKCHFEATNRPPRWQKSQVEVAHNILRHLRKRRQRTIISALGRLIVLIHTYFPRLGDWIILTITRRLKHFYE